MLSSPAKKLYYWSIENESPFNGNPQNNNSILLATYEDDTSSYYWASMLKNYEPLIPFYFSDNNFYTSPHEFLDINGNDGRAVVVRDLMKQIRHAHNDTNIPDPYAAVFQDWTEYGAWHAWNIGVVSQEARNILRSSNLGNTYICGEAYSDAQGWVEGALRSCEKMLIDRFKIQSTYEDYVNCA